MRLLIDLSTFTSAHNGGKDEVAYNLLRGFSKLQVTSNIICIARDEVMKKIKEIDAGYDVITINRISFGTRFGPVISAIPDFVYVAKLNEIIKNKHVDAVLYTNKFVPPVKLNVPTLVIPHDIQPLTLCKLHNSVYNKCTAIMTKNTLSVCDYIIAISNFDRNDMISKAPKYSAKYHTIYNPIFFKDYCYEKCEKKYITAINIQWKHKNVDTIINAYAQVASTTDLNLVLVGKLPKNIEELKAIVKDNNLENRVFFTGFVSDEQMATIIQKTRIYVNASYFEGFGMTSIEMMGSGIPTIVANNTAQKEVTMGLCRYYEPTNDKFKLAEQIIDEIKKPKSETELFEITETIKQRYSYEIVANKYWKFIEMCI